MNELFSALDKTGALAQVFYRGAWHWLEVSVQQDIQLAQLIGIDAQKQAFLKNSEAFLKGKPYHHVQLWGARGTGKSSLIRATYWQHWHQRATLLQLNVDGLAELPALLWAAGQLSRKFVIMIDDLSFNYNDLAYRALKSALDGGLLGVRENVLLCVSSNRRHLVREEHPDSKDLYPIEDMEELLSLSERFGLRLPFHSLSQEAYLAVIAEHLGEVDTPLRRKALQFALAAGSRSARVAKQFVLGYQADLSD